MDRDDAPIGSLLSRREALVMLGAAGVAFVDPRFPALRGRQAPRCVARPEQTQGPYFVDEKLDRRDIRAEPGSADAKPGALLDLEFQVSRLGGMACAPLAGAMVDVWQCDAAGVYSDVRDPRFDSTGQKFLRGYQVTDPQGLAQFTTIYPGWYQGRTVHIHFKIRSAPSESRGFEFTSQLYFDDLLTDRVHARPPYTEQGQGRTLNARDRIFQRGGDQLLLRPSERPDGHGYAARFEIALAV